MSLNFTKTWVKPKECNVQFSNKSFRQKLGYFNVVDRKCSHLVYENVLSAIVRGNEPPSLRHVEPLTPPAPRHPRDACAGAARARTCKQFVTVVKGFTALYICISEFGVLLQILSSFIPYIWIECASSGTTTEQQFCWFPLKILLFTRYNQYFHFVIRIASKKLGKILIKT